MREVVDLEASDIVDLNQPEPLRAALEAQVEATARKIHDQVVFQRLLQAVGVSRWPQSSSRNPNPNNAHK